MEGHLLSYHSWGIGPMPVQACSQLHTLVAIVTHWQREASVVLGINSNPDNTTLNQGAICSEEPPKTPSVRGPLRHFVSMCMCECEWVGKREWARRLIKSWMLMGAGQWGSECVVGEHSHYADFPFSFKTLEEYFLLRSFFLQPGHPLPPMLPTFMLRQGWSEGQKSGNQVNYGWWLADKRERKRARERESTAGRVFFFFFAVFFHHLVEYCWVIAASLAWPDRPFC